MSQIQLIFIIKYNL